MKPFEDWLLKAEHDLKSADFLLTSPEPLYDIAIYHTQQCAEKSLKGFMAFREQEIGRTHNLLTLLDLCIDLEGSFDLLYDNCLLLNPYSTMFRYPESELMPSLSEVKLAIESTRKIFFYIKQLIE